MEASHRDYVFYVDNLSYVTVDSLNLIGSNQATSYAVLRIGTNGANTVNGWTISNSTVSMGGVAGIIFRSDAGGSFNGITISNTYVHHCGNQTSSAPNIFFYDGGGSFTNVTLSNVHSAYAGVHGDPAGTNWGNFGVDFHNASAVTVTNSEFDHNWSSGANIQHGSSGITITGGSMHDNGGSGGDDNAIGVGGYGAGSSNITVNSVDMYGNIGDNVEIASTGSASAPAHDSGQTDQVMANLTFKYNRIRTSQKRGIKIGGGHTGISFQYNEIYSNGLEGYETNAGTSGNPSVVLYANTIYGNGSAGSGNTAANLLINTTGTTLKNGITAEAVGQEIVAPSALISDYNLWYHSAGGTFMTWGATAYNFANWQTNSGQDAHSVNADPKLNNPAGNDFTLQSTSPAIDAGTNLGSPYNMGLDPRTSFPWSTLDQGIYGSWEIGAFVYIPNLGSGNQAAPRYDFLNNSATSATSNHTLVFTINNSLDNTGGSASDTLALTFQSNFDLSNITCGDVNVATGTRFLFNVASPEPRTNCPNTATSWGLLINSASRTITFTVPTVVKTYVATGTIITVSIGSNANYQNQGTHWIVNPSDSGTKSITIGGTFGGYGQILVSVNTAVQLSATINETLTLKLTGLNGSGTGGMNSCSSNGTTDAEDGAAINVINTTAASVPFGTLSSANTFYEGCQKVSVTTNAGNGFTVSVREDHSLRTASGLAIADTACDASGCLNTPSTAAAWVTNTNPGLGISCAQAATSASCSTANPNWANGTKWAPVASEGKNNPTGGTQTPAVFSGLTGVTSVEVITKAKYRIAVPTLQAAGVYTNLVSFIATPVF